VRILKFDTGFVTFTQATRCMVCEQPLNAGIAMADAMLPALPVELSFEPRVRMINQAKTQSRFTAVR
jgi:hypothetical protein